MRERCAWRAGTACSTYALSIGSDGCLLRAKREYRVDGGVSTYDHCLLFLNATMRAPGALGTNQPQGAQRNRLDAQIVLSVSQGCPEPQLGVRSTPWGCSGAPRSQATPAMASTLMKQRQHEVVLGVTAHWDALAWLGEVIPTVCNVTVHTRAVAKDHKTD